MKGTEMAHRSGAGAAVLAKLLLSLTLACAFSYAAMAQNMTDDQVVEYIKKATVSGKSEKQMIVELGRRGVTREQAERIKAKMEAEQNAGDETATGRAGTAVSEVAPEDGGGGFGNPVNRGEAGEPAVTTGEMDEVATNLQNPAEESTKTAARLVYGRNIFRSRNLTFAPSQHMATPENYRLGPGDEVIIEIWGTNQNTIRDEISPDGYINVPDLGLIFLNGMTVKEADSYMRQQLNRIYSSLSGDAPTTEIKLTLGQIRTIQVNVMGDVAMPGTYSLSSLSTVFHALYRAGGVGKLGTVRNVRLIRGGEQIATLDVYGILTEGKADGDVRLEDGDVILVGPYDMIVDISGSVKRSMYYEMKDGETIGDLIRYAGGFTGDAYTGNIRLVRQGETGYKVFTIDGHEYDSFKLRDGDVVTVGQMLDRYENRVEVNGAVYRPGVYELNDEVSTVRQLVEKADGLMDDAFTNRALLHRQKDDFTSEILALDIKAVMDGSSPDIQLRKNDELHIPSIHDLEDFGMVSVLGEVARPGDFLFSDNLTLEDLIIQAGGLLESASTVKVDITRRIKDTHSMDSSPDIAEMYTFALKDGFVVDGDPGFKLQPYDQVFVRRSPAYNEQKNVRIYGEVVFGGDYAMTKKSERLSDLVAKAGGVTEFAYTKGARLIRYMNEEENRRSSRVEEMAQSQSRQDSISLKGDQWNTYYVGIDLEKALANPGSDADIVLREWDTVYVPELNNTVRVIGTVLYPNTVIYDRGQKVKHYIEQSGGFAPRAKRSKVYVVYMNGQVSRARRLKSGLIQPGCEIVVPAKPVKENALQNTLSIATTSASLATMIATIGNIIK